MAELVPSVWVTLVAARSARSANARIAMQTKDAGGVLMGMMLRVRPRSDVRPVRHSIRGYANTAQVVGLIAAGDVRHTTGLAQQDLWHMRKVPIMVAA